MRVSRVKGGEAKEKIKRKVEVTRRKERRYDERKIWEVIEEERGKIKRKR